MHTSADYCVKNKAMLSCLRNKLQQHAITNCLLAYSGGVDSQVLLHLLYQLRTSGMRLNIRAVHINHQLQADAGLWQQHCKEHCHRWQIPLVVRSIVIPEAPACGIEAQARQLRYDVLAEELDPTCCLLTAHHGDDQAETVLLQALRGAGVKGLSAMPSGLSVFAQGYRLRPLLLYSKQQLLDYARQHQLKWVEDQSNQDTRFTRNLLRHQILPQLAEHRSGTAVNLVRVADNMAEAGLVLEEVACSDYLKVKSPQAQDRINVRELAKLSRPRQRLVLRYWLDLQGCRMPSRSVLHQMQDQMLAATDDADPCVSWGRWQLRRFAGYLYLVPIFQPIAPDFSVVWEPNHTVQLPLEISGLSPEHYPSCELMRELNSAHVTVRFRKGGERYQDMAGGIHKKLKKSMQDWSIPPWQRGRIPLIYCGEHLVAVVGYWNYKVPVTSS